MLSGRRLVVNRRRRAFNRRRLVVDRGRVAGPKKQRVGSPYARARALRTWERAGTRVRRVLDVHALHVRVHEAVVDDGAPLGSVDLACVGGACPRGGAWAGDEAAPYGTGPSKPPLGSGTLQGVREPGHGAMKQSRSAHAVRQRAPRSSEGQARQTNGLRRSSGRLTSFTKPRPQGSFWGGGGVDPPPPMWSRVSCHVCGVG